MSEYKRYPNHCMKFSSDDIKKYIYDVLSVRDDVDIRCFSEEDEEIEITSDKKIEFISFDKNENISIMFLSGQTSIFVYDVELMFIDEDSKGIYTSSDVYGNAVYEGRLRLMTHAEMLMMFTDIILCFIGSTDASITNSPAPKDKYEDHMYFKSYLYTINVDKVHPANEVKVYENITINYSNFPHEFRV